ncbi:trypsin-like peptidase domain-containing protein [Cuneatibacter sp. NSJ-177]|uniref:S1C family serine protease n=1 Tax=Cuneatibacter sp. NSJ-177 TaxID=2931401 RepID=UPI001FD0FD3A|nr:trypsin-like peptidase domain-containing protein [Cuneatibacter sp. NSJ-177]MCJ7837259.1 trypsin-like peptidase domain-containing protein [Cuneatibacter sp. NSJ-177]
MSEQWENDNQQNHDNETVHPYVPRQDAGRMQDNTQGGTSAGADYQGEGIYRYQSGEKTYTSDSTSHTTAYSYQNQNGNDNGQPYNGQSYQNPYRNGQAYGGGQPPKKPKKKKPWGKIIGIPVGIVLVCAIIGGAAWGIGRLMGGDEGPQVAQGTTTEAGSTKSPETPAAESAIPTGQVKSNGSGQATVTDASDVVEASMPSVVAITSTIIYNNYSDYYGYFYGQNGGQKEVTGAGSGIIIGDNGTELWIVTNNHVVADSESLKVTFNDGTTVDAYIKGTDSENDLAVVGVSMDSLSEETKNSITKMELGDSDALRLGQGVIAIGNALGLGQSVSTGVISAVDREIQMSDGSSLNLLQTDAAINPGNSGGALIDMNGKLIGINVAKYSDNEVEGMGFAIPISKAKDIIEELSAKEPRQKVSDDQYPYLGVQLKDLSSNYTSAYGIPSGVLVYSVEEGSPAAEGGLQTQDIITGFEGEKISTYDDLNKQLAYYSGGTTVTITVQRLEKGQYVEKELSVTLGLKSDYQN